MTITFIGHGYVGLVTAAVFADLGNTVWVIGHTPKKIENLKKGIIPIYEPGLEEIVKRNLKAKRLLFTMEYDQAIAKSEVVFIAVGTPPKKTGEADLSVVFDVAGKLAKYLDGYTVVATKSTVPIGTNRRIKQIIEDAKPDKTTFDTASVPEFLREGQAISDTLHPDRIVLGTDSHEAQKLLIELHKPIDAKLVLTNLETAEMIKYAANSFLATKISFANAIAQLSELVNSNGPDVLKAIGLDNRIGPKFLNAGAGWGGSCFGKDVKALIAIAADYGYEFTLLKEVENINKDSMMDIVNKVTTLLKGKIDGREIGILGLSFKPDTDDMRDAPSITVINELRKKGAKIKAYDPIAMKNAKKILSGVVFCPSAMDAAKDCDAVVIMTEWNEFRQLDVKKLKQVMKQPNLVDGRNIYDTQKMKELGFAYMGVGR